MNVSSDTPRQSPLTSQQLEDLFSALDSMTHCNHDFTHTRAFLQRERLDAARVLPWLQKRGGYCDCEVAMNVEGEEG